MIDMTFLEGIQVTLEGGGLYAVSPNQEIFTMLKSQGLVTIFSSSSVSGIADWMLKAKWNEVGSN